MNFGGAISGVGVTTGAPQVYLVFWGSQWGTSSTDGNGNTRLSGDPQGVAGVVQQFFKGIGTGSGPGWSGVMTQYCEGVATGSQTCPSSAAHVGAPNAGGALAGVWVDTSAAAPSSATGKQIGQEALAAAQHFGNTSSASVPLALIDAVESGRVHDGDLLLLAGFGAGMTWSSAVWRWRDPPVR